MTYWRATVERPDGAGGWTTVAVFGTPDTPGNGSARHLHGATPLEAATILLRHVWPVNLADFNLRKDLGKWRAERAAKTDIADHRITIDVCAENRWSHFGEVPEPLVVTVAEMRLAEVRAEVAELVANQAKLAELTEQIRRARGDVQHGRYRVDAAKEEAVRAGVDEAEVKKAGRVPRAPVKKRVTRA